MSGSLFNEPTKLVTSSLDGMWALAKSEAISNDSERQRLSVFVFSTDVFLAAALALNDCTNWEATTLVLCASPP